MQTLNRLRRAGAALGSVSRRHALAVLAAVAAVASGACHDGFFFDPAPGRITPVAVQWTLVGVSSAGVASAPQGRQEPGSTGSMGPQASPGAAFDKADGARVVLRAGDKELFNQRLTLEAAGSDKKVSFSVDLPAGSAVQASLELTLLRGQDALFTGSATAQLTPGQSAEVSIPLGGVFSRIETGGPYVIRTLGGTLKVTAVGLFATGDSAGLTATYRALDANVTVASDGTVTAVSNGSARVEATYLGRSDTAAVTVEDRCYGPFVTLALGQTANGTLEANDCNDPANSSYNDWYQFTVSTPTLVRATVTGTGFEPFLGANYPDKKVLGVAANAGGNVVISDYHLPAGTYLVRAGSRAGSLPAGSPNPTGTYSLRLEGLSTTETEAGCLAGRVATWMVPGNEATAQATAADCLLGSSSTQRYDRYGVRLQPGDTATVTVVTSFPFYLQYSDPNLGQSPLKQSTVSVGDTIRWVMTGATDASHYLLVSPLQQTTGQYTIRVEKGIPAAYDPCAGPFPMLQVIGGFSTPKGTLSPRITCQEDGQLVQRYSLSVGPSTGPFTTTLASTAFDPFVVAYRGAAQTAGRASTTGTVVAEHVYPAGIYSIGATAVNPVSAGSRYSGAYTLSAALVAFPQEGCPATGFRSTFVDFGSRATGRITSNDCRDLFSPDTATVTRWVDGYAILLQPGETVTVTLSADFPTNFTRWVGNTYADGRFNVPAGQTSSFTVTQPAGSAAFHVFNAISGQHQATGNYTMTFTGTPLPAPQRVEGSGGWRPPMKWMADDLSASGRGAR